MLGVSVQWAPTSRGGISLNLTELLVVYVFSQSVSSGIASYIFHSDLNRIPGTYYLLSSYFSHSEARIPAITLLSCSLQLFRLLVLAIRIAICACLLLCALNMFQVLFSIRQRATLFSALVAGTRKIKRGGTTYTVAQDWTEGH